MGPGMGLYMGQVWALYMYDRVRRHPRLKSVPAFAFACTRLECQLTFVECMPRLTFAELRERKRQKRATDLVHLSEINPSITDAILHIDAEDIKLISLPKTLFVSTALLASFVRGFQSLKAIACTATNTMVSAFLAATPRHHACPRSKQRANLAYLEEHSPPTSPDLLALVG